MMLMALLLIVSLGLLSLSSITLRTSVTEDPMRVARANARLALTMALNELQLQLGDDRRVTADASILGEDVRRPHLLGVWDSAVPGEHTENPLEKAVDYDAMKRTGFRRWLVSHPSPDEAGKQSLAESPLLDKPARLFAAGADGFDLYGDLIPVHGESGTGGAMAWAVSQEATKAGINVGGHDERYAENDVLQAPDRPNLSLSKVASQPEGGWDVRPAKVINLRQAALDTAYGLDKAGSALLGREHTALSRGLQVDVVKGGLKTDLSLGFELDDGDFKAASWDGIRNPFANGSAPGGEVPLYRPVTSQQSVEVNVDYEASTYTHYLDTGLAPTFHSLRSYYRLPHHLYRSSSGSSLFFRSPANPGYARTTAPRGSEVSVSPVLDRVLLFLSVMITTQNVPALVVTPVISLWNPYNTAIESEGFVIYPWRDLPINLDWTITGWADNQPDRYLSRFMGLGVASEHRKREHGRQTNPYFLCKLTATGTANVSTPIRLEPGEVRVFVPASPVSPSLPNISIFDSNVEANRSVFMVPMGAGGVTKGGIVVPLNRETVGPISVPRLDMNGTIQLNLNFNRKDYPYIVSMEDATRIKNPQNHTPLSIQPLAEVQVVAGARGVQQVTSPAIPMTSIRGTPRPVALLETFHRTAGTPNEECDVVFTVNPRGRHTNSMISGMSNIPNSHYDSQLTAVGSWETEAFQTKNGRSFYGLSNSAGSGRDYLSFYELPREPMLSLGGFQNADFSDSAFAPGAQFGNSWASAYVARNTTGTVLKSAIIDLTKNQSSPLLPSGLGMYDHSYLMNQALWDGYFFSSIAPELSPGSRPRSADPYDSTQARVVRDIDQVVRDWVADPRQSPLRNPRYLLHRGGMSDEELKDRLTSPAGCRYAAGHLLVDGMFNVNSVNESAWAAVLGSLRDSSFEVGGDNGAASSHRSRNTTPAPRMRYPTGTANDSWNGFRELSDNQIQSLAKEIVEEVRKRGPFQSLGEFVNRRISSDELGLKGALQAAIDRAGLNDGAKLVRFKVGGYPQQENLSDPNTGIGTPGWLTQGDLLTALAPFISVRSDTFTVRGYGEARDGQGKVTARAWCEMVVQRVPEWLNPADQVTDLPEDLSPSSARFGRRFEVVSFRELSREEFNELSVSVSS